MFDFAWSEIALVGVLALVLIGPKDLPVAIKAVTQMLKKARRMAGEFQTHVDELVREADLHEVREGFNELRRMDIKGKILSAVDGDGSIRSGLSNPLTPAASAATPSATPDPMTDIAPAPPPIPVHDTHMADAIAPEPALVATPPAFVPPGYAPKPPRPVPPAFVPPAAAKLAEHA